MSDLLTRINQHGVLRVPLSFWLMVAFQARHWFLVAAAVIGMRRSPDTARLLGSEGVPFLQLALELPVMLLAFAALNRDPFGGAFVRAVWQRGREIFTLAAALNLAWVAWYFAGIPRWRPNPDNLVLLSGLIDLLIVAVVWRSAYIRQMFAEFPAPKPPETGS
ncbi:MAG: DUF2919 family protein [Burkholderiales bacterium]|nr:DUF2919 family protein [Burkholderiales bacterium]